MAFTFDGPNLIIIVDAIGTFDAKVDFYSDWKEWVKLGDNAKFPLAFDTTGGDPTRLGQTIAPYFFLRNDLGWRVRPPEANGEVIIVGNLFRRDSSIEAVIPTLGAFTLVIRLEVSPQALVVEGALSALEKTQLDELHKLHGLLIGSPLEVKSDERKAGADIVQVIDEPVAGTTRVTRSP